MSRAASPPVSNGGGDLPARCAPQGSTSLAMPHRMISTGQKRQKRCQMPRSGWKRARRNKIPRTTRSKPLKIELRCGPPLLTRASRAEMTVFGSERLRRQHDAGDDQQDRPKFQETEARVFADQKKDAHGDDHQRAHQAAYFAIGAVAYRLSWVAHFGLP